MKPNDGIPIFGPMLEAGLYDPHDAPRHTDWCPFNKEASELASCLEACKQVLELQSTFERRASRRAWAMLGVPVTSLSEHTRTLQTLLARHDHSGWPEGDRQAFTTLARELKPAMKRLAPFRNKLGAHCDPDAVGPQTVIAGSGANLVLPPMGLSLCLLVLSLNHAGTFSYYRVPDPNNPLEIQITVEYPIATLLRLDASGRPERILTFQVAEDPRGAALPVVRQAIAFHNALAATAPGHSAITLTEYEDDATRKKRASRDWRVRIL